MDRRRLRSSAGFCLVVLSLLTAAPEALAEVGAALEVSPDLQEIIEQTEHGRTAAIMLVLFQLSAMLVAAKLLGWLAESLKVPGVVGELLAGALIGPYLLGSLIHIPLHGISVPLFPAPGPGQWPLNDIVWAFAQFASIVLLFVTGLHTDLKQFVRYMVPATSVAVVGVVVPFLLGAGAVYFVFYAGIWQPPDPSHVLIPALFTGTILSATSIGITARVLGDIEKLDSPEGVTILGAAVLDDVLGIIALAIVGGIAEGMAVAGGVDVSVTAVGWIAFKAIGVWVGLTVVTFLLAPWIERGLNRIRYGGAVIAIGLALAFVCSGIAESFGLAFIIGAYSVGLGLSRTNMANRLMEELRPIEEFIVPIFFVSLGMLVNFGAMLADWRVITFGLLVTAAGVVGKLVGCGLTALPMGFNRRGAYRIGLGMLPRGEVALIVASIGLSRALVDEEIFGVAIMMTLITTTIGPILLVPAFQKGGRGLAKPVEGEPQTLPSASEMPGIVVQVPEDLANVLVDRLVRVAEKHGWDGTYERFDQDFYLLRSGRDAAQVQRAGGQITIDASDARQVEFEHFLKVAQNSITAELEEIKPTPLEFPPRRPAGA